MPTYVALMKYTQKGVETIKEAPARMENLKQAGKAIGVELKQWYLVLGQYDIVAVVEAANDETIARMSLLISMQGRTRTETLRVFTEEEFYNLVATLP